MNKTFFVFFVIFVHFSNVVYSQFSGGSGIQVDPYLISTRADMEALADSVAKGNYWSKDKYFELINDIADSVKKCVGLYNSSSDRQYAFLGYFDGKTYKITLSIQYYSSTLEDIGCFGHTQGATIKNLVVDGKVINESICGGIVGVGHNGSTIKNCINFCSVASSRNPGGIVGRINGNNSTVENCINLGNVTGGASQTGGIVGDGQSSTMIGYNLNLGNLYSSGNTGGINGDLTADHIYHCINAGFIPKGNPMYGDNKTTELETSINVGVTERNYVSKTCFFDKQMFAHNSSNATESQGRLTNNSEITGWALQNILDTIYWIFEDSLYPRLKNMPMEEPGYVAASPVFLRINSDSDFDTYNRVRHCFKVSNKNGVKWRSTNGRVKIDNKYGFAKLISTGSDTLIAYLVEPKWGKEITKTIPINITELNDNFSLTVTAEPEQAGDIHRELLDCYTEVISATPVACHRFLHWEDKSGKIISYKQTDAITLKSDSTLIAIFTKNEEGDDAYKIRVGQHLAVSPTLSKYTIPIYITATKNISNITVNNLAFVVNENVFSPTSVPNCKMSYRYYEDTVEIIIDNIFVSSLEKDRETILCSVVGKTILGNMDSSIIRIDSVIIDCGKVDYENGSINIDICYCCDEDGKRLLHTDDVLPKIIVKENPVKDILSVECYCTERGDYTLEIIDALGNISVVEKWRNTKTATTHNFEIPISNIAIGNYMIIMNAPKRIRYHSKFSKI